MLTGSGPGLACQDTAGRVFGRFWNRTEPFFRPEPGPLAGYPDPLLTLCKPLRMVLTTLQNPVYHRRRDVRSVHQTMQNSHLSHSRELVEITRSIIITIGSSVQ